MKTIRSLLPCLFLLSPAWAQDQSAKELLRDGLFEEEANADLDKAEATYQQLIDRFDAERRYAGTALFRLAEIAKKRGNKEQAATLYRRVIQEFADQGEIAKRARAAMTQAGIGVPPSPNSAGIGATARGPMAVGKERDELRRLEILKHESPDLLDGLDPTGNYPLHTAAAEGWMEVIKFLLAEKVTVDSRASTTGMTPLHVAVVFGRLGVVKLLLEAGADHSASFSAAAQSLPVPPPASLKGAGGSWTPIHLAIAYGRSEVAAALLASGASTAGHGLYTSKANNRADYVSPLMLAMHLNMDAMVEFLIEKGADVDQKVYAMTALVYAADYRQKYVPVLVRHGADPNLGEGQYGNKPIHVAINERDEEMVKMLLKAGADPNAMRGDEPDGVSALDLAANMNSGMGRLFLEVGAKPTPRAMESMIRFQAVDDLKLMIAADTERKTLNFKTKSGTTWLHTAVNKEIAEVLLAAGIEINTKTAAGHTLLDHAVARKDTPKSREFFDYLVSKGAVSEHLVWSEEKASKSRSKPFPTSAKDLQKSLLPYALDRLAYPELMEPDRVRLSYLNERLILEGERRVIEGTPPPTLSELLGGARTAFPGTGELGWLRVLRKEDGKVCEVVRMTAADVLNLPLPELQWGDLVEISKGENSSAGWLRTVLYDYEPRTVTFKMGQWEEKLLIEADPVRSNTRSAYLYLDVHLGHASRLFDLSKVTLRRGEAEPMVLDFTNIEDAPRILLVDGDLIEVPRLPGPTEGGRSWDGIVVLQPDAPSTESPGQGVIYKPKTLFEMLRNAGSWRGGRDLSRIEIHGWNGSIRKINLEAIMNKSPQYEWTIEKLANSDEPLLDGDLVIVPPHKDLLWSTRSYGMSLRGTKLDAFLKALFPENSAGAPRSSPAAAIRSSSPRVVLPRPPSSTAPARRRVVPTPPTSR